MTRREARERAARLTPALRLCHVVSSRMEETPHSRMAEFRRGLARYAPISRVAAGGMGEVWRGEASFPDGHVQEVAIKRVLPHLANDPLYRRMLEDEARLGMLLRHPNIVRVFDARTQGSFILVMEYVEGRSLRQIVDRITGQGSRVPVAAALHIAHSVASALQHAHEAHDDLGRELCVIHGDVSPHNVLLGIDGQVKLMDFGLARASANLADRPMDRISGKYGYLAPEVVLRREASQSMDLFALGVVTWECLTGKRLFPAKNMSDCRKLLKEFEVPKVSLINPAVTGPFETALARMLTKTPEERFPNARALRVALEAIIAPLPQNMCREATARLVQLNLGGKRRRSDAPRATHLSEAELDEFFASCATTLYQRPSLAPLTNDELEAFVTELDTGLTQRLPET
jgi:serine/threonine protein kinase